MGISANTLWACHERRNDQARLCGRRTGEQAEAVAARRSSGGAAERTTVGSGGEDATDLPLRSDIPIAYLYHPLFQRLLEAARDTCGYGSAGPLWLPCSVDEFLRLRACRPGDGALALLHYKKYVNL